MAAIRGQRGGSATEEYGRDAGLLTVAVGLSGALVYAYFVLASHSLSADDYGELAVLWSIVYVVGAILFRPVEQLLARSLAEGEPGTASATRVIRAGAVLQVGLIAIAIGLAFAGRGVLESDLIGEEPAMFAILVAALATAALNFLARGYLAGGRRFGAYAGLLLFESCSRALFALVVAVGIGSGQSLAALGIAAAPLIGMAVVPAAIRTASRDRREERAEDIAEELPAGDRRRPARFVTGVLLIMLSEQIIITAPALIVRWSEGAALAGFAFNIFVVARAPLVLFQAAATSLLPHLTRLQATPGEQAEREFARSVRVTVLGCAGAASLVTLAVALAGPQLMQAAFGDSFEYDRLGLVIVAIGMGLYLAATTLSQAALARGQVSRAATCWIASAVLFVAANLPGGLDRIRQVEVAFAASGLLLCLLLYVVYRAPAAAGTTGLEPGSASELEARLAAAEEAS